MKIRIIFTFIAMTAVGGAQVDLQQGLVGFYSFNEIADSVVVNQATGETSAPDGIIVSDSLTGEVPLPIDGISGDALLFTTLNQAHVALGIYDPSAETDQLAISCWIIWEGLDGNWQPIAGLRDGWDPPTIGWSMVLDQSSGGLQFETNTDNGKVFIITPDPPTLGEWTHIVLNFDGAWASYYFDGEWVVEGEMQFGEGRDTSPFRIGAGWTDGNAFNGVIDEFRIYNRVLTEEEIKYLYDNPGGGESAVHTSPNTPQDFALEQNYPNPFNPSTSVSYTIPRPEFVSLSIYNMRGEKMLTLVDEYQNAGFYTETFDAGEIPTGIYLLRLQAGSVFHDSIKMLYIK